MQLHHHLLEQLRVACIKIDFKILRIFLTPAGGGRGIFFCLIFFLSYSLIYAYAATLVAAYVAAYAATDVLIIFLSIRGSFSRLLAGFKVENATHFQFVATAYERRFSHTQTKTDLRIGTHQRRWPALSVALVQEVEVERNLIRAKLLASVHSPKIVDEIDIGHRLRMKKVKTIYLLQR